MRTDTTVTRKASGWRVWHFVWSSTVVGALLLNVLWPVYPGYSIWALSLAGYPIAAALILTRRPGNRVGRILAVVGISAGVIFVGGWAVSTWPTDEWSALLEAIIPTAAPLVFWGAIALLYVFPTGRTEWRGFAMALMAFTVILCAMAAIAPFAPGPMALTGRPNPLAGPPWIGSVYDAGIVVLLPGLLGGVWAAGARFRSSDAEVRAQLRWFTTGIAAVTGLVAVVAFLPEALPSPYEEIASAVVIVGWWSPPASIVIAVTRYRLYEIDRIISRTLSYAVVAIVVAAIYALPVVTLHGLLGERNDLVVAGSTLAAAAAFDPVRRRTQRAINKRFNRAPYDSERELDAFAARLTGQVELATVTQDLSDVVHRTLAPSSSALWLRNLR